MHDITYRTILPLPQKSKSKEGPAAKFCLVRNETGFAYEGRRNEVVATHIQAHHSTHKG